MSRGYTLIEIIAAFVIFSVSFAVLYTGLGFVLKTLDKIKIEKAVQRFEVFTIAEFAESFRLSTKLTMISEKGRICERKLYGGVSYTLCNYLIYKNNLISPKYKVSLLKESEVIIRVPR